MRLVGRAVEVYKYLEPLLNDFRKIRRRQAMGWTLTTMDQFIEELLTQEMVCDIAMPYLLNRDSLVKSGTLEVLLAALRCPRFYACKNATPYVFFIWYGPKSCAKMTGAAASVARRRRECLARAGRGMQASQAFRTHAHMDKTYGNGGNTVFLGCLCESPVIVGDVWAHAGAQDRTRRCENGRA